MKIYDCFQFFNEEDILDLRLNILDEFVNFFVIVESTTDHQGNTKKLNFDMSKFKKFEKKIIYIVVNDTSESIKKPTQSVSPKMIYKGLNRRQKIMNMYLDLNANYNTIN